MLISYKILLAVLCICVASHFLSAQGLTYSKTEVSLSATKGTVSRVDTVRLLSKNGSINTKLKITGAHAALFKATIQKEISPAANTTILITFGPPTTFVGIANAVLEAKGKPAITLTGLSTKGLEGENEAPLADIVATLGYKIDIGWRTLANHWRPELQGEELEPALFEKAKAGNVEMIPVARYSPDFALNFGYYTQSGKGPVQHQCGILSKAGKFPEHQILYPTLATGKTTFDPGNASFGFYSISPTHSIYSEDIWNILFYQTHATHAMRIYPVRNRQNVRLENTYLVAMEEAANGDYNDYVFIVKNIQPVYTKSSFSSLTNGKDLSGWHTWFRNLGKDNDSNHIFTFDNDGVLHDLGKDLGYMITEKSFGNFHLTLEFKWGEKRWAPRDANKRDSGICYNIPDGDQANERDVWPPSIECQIQEGDVGDMWLLGYSTIQVDGKQNPPLNHSQIVKKKDGERPLGEWNTVEVISFNGKCAHVVNGVLVHYGDNASLVGGRILLQSEYAELYYKHIRIREL